MIGPTVKSSTSPTISTLPDGGVAVGIANGVLGELWQGPAGNSVAVISLPIECASWATATKSTQTIDPTLNMTPLRKAAFHLFEEKFGANYLAAKYLSRTNPNNHYTILAADTGGRYFKQVYEGTFYLDEKIVELHPPCD